APNTVVAAVPVGPGASRVPLSFHSRPHRSPLSFVIRMRGGCKSAPNDRCPFRYHGLRSVHSLMTSPTRRSDALRDDPDQDCLPETVLQLLSDATAVDEEALRKAAATLSHELRTPLTTIYTGSKLLRRRA